MEAEPQAALQRQPDGPIDRPLTGEAADAVRQRIGTDTGALLDAARHLVETGQRVEARLHAAECRAAELSRLTGLQGRQGADMISAIRALDESNEPASLAAVKALKRNLRLRHAHAPLLDAAVQAGIPVLLYGDSGSGKTTAVRHIADAFDVKFSSNSAANLPAAATKPAVRTIGHPFTIQETLKNGGIFLFDDLSADQPEILRTIDTLVAPSTERGRHQYARFAAATDDRSGWVAQTLSHFVAIPWPTDWELVRARREGQPNVTATEVDITDGGLPDADSWLTTVEKYAAAAERTGLGGHVTSHSEDYGARLAAHGVGLRWLKELCIYRGLGGHSRTQLDHALTP